MAVPRSVASASDLGATACNSLGRLASTHLLLYRVTAMDRTQCKMARAALGWRAADLAQAAGIHRVTVARYESGEPIEPQSLAAMQKALEDRGAQFLGRSGRVGVTV